MSKPNLELLLRKEKNLVDRIQSTEQHMKDVPHYDIATKAHLKVHLSELYLEYKETVGVEYVTMRDKT